MKSLHVGVFNSKLICQASPFCGDRVFYNGFLANGYEAFLFDYRANQLPNEELIKYAKEIEPDLFWFGKCELIHPETIKQLRTLFPRAIFAKWAADCRLQPTSHDLGHLKYINVFVATFGGEYLKLHADAMPSGSKAMSIITFTDSDYYRTIENIRKKYISDVLWTGRRGFGDNKMRNEIIDYLTKKQEFQVKVFGVENTEWIQDDYVEYINGTKIGIGSNSYNKTKYSSDRLGNYITCGTFYLPQYFEGIEEIFTKGLNLDWFASIDELDEKIKFYLKNDNIREKISKESKKLILEHFDCKPLVQNILYFIKTGNSKNSWDDIY